MKLGILFAIGSALLLIAAALVVDVTFFPREEDDQKTLQTVELLSEVEEEKPDETEPEPDEPEEIETEVEEPPDAAEIMKNLDTPALVDAPALEIASLSAIEAALNGQGGGGDFAQALSFDSGGRIGGRGRAGEGGDTLEDAFSMAELDQKPRAVFQGSPVYPAEMRGKKVEGQVTLIFVVDPAGKVDKPRIENSSHKAFEGPALNAIKKWKFEPGIRGGERVSSKMRISIRFPPG